MGYRLALKETEISEAENLLEEHSQLWEGQERALIWL